GRPGLTVQVWEKPLRGDGKLLAERTTLGNGFFDIPYAPPRNDADGQIKMPFHLRVRVVDAAGKEADAKVRFNPTAVDWVNFTEGSEPYRGTSEYDRRMKAISKVLGKVPISEIEETRDLAHPGNTNPRLEITHVALNSGLDREDVMCLALAARAAKELADQEIPPPA